MRHYRRGQVIKLGMDDFPFFCIVLSGSAGGYQTNRRGQRVLRELALPLDFFTGTEHTFSSTRRPLDFAALRASTLLLLPIAYAREGQRLHTEISELFHVLKQRKILRLRKLVDVYQEPNHGERYRLFRELLPEVAHSPATTNAIHADLLQMSVSHLKRLKKRFLVNH